MSHSSVFESTVRYGFVISCTPDNLGVLGTWIAMYLGGVCYNLMGGYSAVGGVVDVLVVFLIGGYLGILKIR